MEGSSRAKKTSSIRSAVLVELRLVTRTDTGPWLVGYRGCIASRGKKWRQRKTKKRICRDDARCDRRERERERAVARHKASVAEAGASARWTRFHVAALYCRRRPSPDWNTRRTSRSASDSVLVLLIRVERREWT